MPTPCSLRRTALRAVALVACMTTTGMRLPAQAAPVGTKPGRIELLSRQRDTTGARRLADSILADTDPADPRYAEALYWRGVLTGVAAAGRRDLLRLVVDHPTAPRAGDALYLLARHDLATGDTAGARRRLERGLREYPTAEHAALTALELGRLLLAHGELRNGCIMLDSALARLAPDQVERRNEISYLRRGCRPVLDAPPAADSLTATRDVVAKAEPRTASADSAPQMKTRNGAAPRQMWSVQVAAYSNHADAAQFVKRLATRGLTARVTIDRPYRVRIGRFAIRNDAEALARRLKASGTTAIVVEAERQ
jgi:cell division septation protein DedD